MFRKFLQAVIRGFFKVVEAVSASAAAPYLAFKIYTVDRVGKGFLYRSQETWKEAFWACVFSAIPYYGGLITLCLFGLWWWALTLVAVPTIFISIILLSQ